MKTSGLTVLGTCGLLLEMEGRAPKSRTHERCGSALPSLREERKGYQMFSQQEHAYLQTQLLARLATVEPDGQPDVDVVGFEFDGVRFYIGGHQIETTRKYKNIAAGQRKVSLIIDDLKTRDPWAPRAIKIHGVAEVVERKGRMGPGSYIAITPTVSWSWGIEEPQVRQGKVGHKKIIWA